MDNLSIRALKQSDFEDLKKALMYAASWRDQNYALDPGLLYIIENWSEAEGDSGLVAELDGGETAGVLWSRYWTDNNHSYGYISPDIPELGMAVFPAYRGRGIGKKLLNEHQNTILRQALAGEAPRAALSLSVEKENQRAFALYTSCGFTVSNESDTDFTMMWKPRWNVREFSNAHIPSAISIWKQSEGVVVYSSREDSPEGIADFLSHNPGLSFVVELQDSSGSIAAAVMGGFDGRRGYVYHLAVHSAFKRCGMARSLLDAIAGALEKKGVPRMHIMVLQSNVQAHEFYNHLGLRFRDDIALFTREI